MLCFHGPKGIWPSFDFINYAYLSTWIKRTLKEAVLWSTTTRPALGKQNIQAKEVYCAVIHQRIHKIVYQKFSTNRWFFFNVLPLNKAESNLLFSISSPSVSAGISFTSFRSVLENQSLHLNTLAECVSMFLIIICKTKNKQTSIEEKGKQERHDSAPSL